MAGSFRSPPLKIRGSRSILPRSIRPLFFRSFPGSRMYFYSSFFSFDLFLLPHTILDTSYFFLFPQASSPFHMRGSSSRFCSVRYSSYYGVATTASIKRSPQLRHHIRHVTKRDETACRRWLCFCLQRQDKEAVSCRTRSCRTTLTLKRDENGVYTDETPVHTHPPHETIIASLKHKEN